MNALETMVNFCRDNSKQIGLWIDIEAAAADLARITAERDAAISDLQDAVDFVYNVYGENNETLAAITTAHWRAVIADVKRSV